MKIARHHWHTQTRPCTFSLCLQGGSVFADFNVDADGHICLVRISFDGYGCCSPLARTPMAQLDSQALLRWLETDECDGDLAATILRRYFERCMDQLWSDALVEHGLLDR